MRLHLILLVLNWYLPTSKSFPTSHPQWRQSRYIIDNRKTFLFSKPLIQIYSEAVRVGPKSLNSHKETNTRKPISVSGQKGRRAETSVEKIDRQYRSDSIRPNRWKKMDDDMSDGDFEVEEHANPRNLSGPDRYNPQNLIQTDSDRRFHVDLESRELEKVKSEGSNVVMRNESEDEFTSSFKGKKPFGAEIAIGFSPEEKVDESLSFTRHQNGYIVEKSKEIDLESKTPLFQWNYKDRESEEENKIGRHLAANTRQVYEAGSEEDTVSYYQGAMFDYPKLNRYSARKDETQKDVAENESADIADKESYDPTGKNYEAEEVNYEKAEKNYEEEEENHEQEEKNYEEEERKYEQEEKKCKEEEKKYEEEERKYKEEEKYYEQEEKKYEEEEKKYEEEERKYKEEEKYYEQEEKKYEEEEKKYEEEENNYDEEENYEQEEKKYKEEEEERKYEEEEKYYEQEEKKYEEEERKYEEEEKYYEQEEKKYEEEEKYYEQEEKKYEEEERKFEQEEKKYEAEEMKYEAEEKKYEQKEKEYEAEEKKYEEEEKKYEEEEKNYEQEEKNYEQEEKNYEEEEEEKYYEKEEKNHKQSEFNYRVDPMARIPTKDEDGNKFGYVVDEKNYRKYRVEERTVDGFIVGEYGVVRHDDGSLRGVRYTADGATNPQLIYEALVKFLSL